jgi:O-antigen ligase
MPQPPPKRGVATSTDTVPHERRRQEASEASVFALSILVLLTLCTPWALGGVSPLSVRLITLTALGAAAFALALSARAGALLPAVPVLPFAALAGFGLLQLVPLPQAVLRIVAPGPAAVWFPADPAAAAILAGTGGSISVSPDATLVSAWLLAALLALAFIAGPAAAAARGGADIAAWAVAFSGAALSVYAIVARALFGPLLYGRFAVPTIMPFGPYVSKNHFAGYVAMAAVLSVGLLFDIAAKERTTRSPLSWIDSPRAYRVLLCGAAVVVMAAAVLVSLSRGGAISLAAGTAAFFALRALGARRPLPVLLAVVLGASALVAVLPRDVHRRLATLGDSTGAPGEAASFRLDTWRDSLRLAAASPVVGSGLGAFVDALPPAKRSGARFRIEHAENDYLEWLAETGISGLLLLGCAGWFLARAARGRLAGGAAKQRALMHGALGAVVVFLVHSAVDFTARIPSNALLFVLLAALLCGTAAGRAGRPQTLAMAAVLAAGALWLWRAPSLPVPTPRADALAAGAIGDPVARGLRVARAEAALVTALHRRPADAEAWFLLGWVRYAQGRSADAAAFARRAQELDPSRTALRERAAALLQAAGGSGR